MDHTSQPRRNYRAYRLLRNEALFDWATTALFYTALHLVDGWIEAQLGTVPQSHTARAEWMARLDVPAAVCKAYDTLRANSQKARYEDWTGTINSTHVTGLHHGAYRVVCEQFDAPDAIAPR